MFYASGAESDVYARLPGGVGRWSFKGYTSVDEAELPDSLVLVTPVPMVEVLTAGYVAGFHESAARQ